MASGQADQAQVGAEIIIPGIWWVAPIMSIVALIFAYIMYKEVKAAPVGDEKMVEIAGHVSRGAMAYLKRQYKIVLVFFFVVACILAFMGFVLHVQHEIVFLAFLTGGFFSGLCGYLGMKTATMASNRTAQGAKEGLNRGLRVAFRAGAVMGLVVVGFGLLDITGWFLVLSKSGWFHMSLTEITVVMLCFGMGASSQALFARVGGGIFTKAADVGADLVGKVEAGIPEDDPRNPATIADNVGDNVGDVAGMGADLYESYCGSILATAALGVSAAITMGGNLDKQIQLNAAMQLLALPMVLAGVGIILSIVGIYLVRTQEGATMKQLMGALNRGVFGSSFMILIAAFFVCYFLLQFKDSDGNDIQIVCWYGIWGSICVGMLAGIVIGKSTEYYTSYDFKPTKEVSANSETGTATVIIAGVAEGMKSTWASLLTVIIAIILAFSFAGGGREMLLGLYGVGIAAVSMLATLGITLATDAYGPIADNAGGNAEMTGQEPQVRERTDALDSLGNTTAAVGKGFAIGSAALTALALLAAYVEEVRVGQIREGTEVVAQVYEGAADKDGENIGVGAMVYNDYGKIGHKSEAGTKVEAFDEFMILRGSKDYLEKLKPYAGQDLADISNLGDPNPDTDIRAMTINLDNEQLELEIVGAHSASLRQYMQFYDVTPMNPKVLCGMFAGVLLVFLFSAMTMKAVGRAAMAMVKEVRRQFKEIPGIMEGTGTPDYARCVEISTAGAQKEMVVPSLLALAVPVFVGLIFGVGGVMGLLAGGLTCGFAMAIFMANAGGAWDNAKKYIEKGNFGGKGSENHKATVVGDTVGDPFKDTSGPSLNILIKLMSMVSVVFAGLIVKYAPIIADLLGLG
ncbi:MAG: sodium-translocating pyrophosphatase [Planctomycetes bacterium]|nr:sodium-translocating pyrophosphatase [Planctomycetota bacterium]